MISSGGFEPSPQVTCVAAPCAACRGLCDIMGSYLTRGDLKHFLSHGIRDVNRVTLLQVFDAILKGFRVFWCGYLVLIDEGSMV